MADIPASLFFNFFIFLFIPFLLALFLKKYRVSPLIGYILGGIVLSNFLDGLISKETINQFAYFGIILLLFTIGLEIQFEQIIVIKKYIVLGSLFQLSFSIIFISLISLFFGFNLIQSLLIGLAFSSSSTAIVAKIIQDRGEESSFLGELTLGILMFQDLAFIPFMVIFTSITSQLTNFLDISGKITVDLVFSSLILFFAYVFGRRLIPYLFDKVAKSSRELLNLFIIVFIFLIAYVSTILHVPILVSMFVAGILISQTLEHYHIFSQIRPLRDLLAIIFFVYIGSNMVLFQIYPQISKILVFTTLVVFIKGVIILLIFLFLKFNSRLSFFLSSHLFQIDEDAFILTSVAYFNKIFTRQEYLFLTSVILLSLVVTPFVINEKEKIYLNIRVTIGRFIPFLDFFLKNRIDFNQSPIDVLNISNHIIICGYGRMGSYIGRALMLANVPFMAIDYNFHAVEQAKREGINIIYGDPTDSDILDYVQVESAIALILALPERYSQEAIILNARKLNPSIVIIARVHRKHDQQRIAALGADVVIQPEFEASVSIIKKIFLMKKFDKDDIIKKLRYFKTEQLGV